MRADEGSGRAAAGASAGAAGGPDAAGGGNTNVNLSGAGDFGYVRRLLDDGIVPDPDELEPDGFFAEHHTPLPEPDCGERVCTQAMLGVLGNLINGNNCTMLQIGLNSPLIADLIFKGEVGTIKEIMKKSREIGMQTFDQSLFDLYEAQKISYEDALRNADSINDLRLNIKLNSKHADRDLNRGIEHLDVL